jgi:lipopolysaccharide export system permease protein
MLKILDRYIIRKFLTTFFFMMAVIMLLATVFDLSEKLGGFLKNNASIQEVLSEYYIGFVLHYANMFSSMIIFVSVIWFTAKMAQETEIIPIWNSGQPFSRFVRPYMLAATILMLISMVFNHFIIPETNRIRLNFEEKFYRDEMYVQNYHAEFPGNQVVNFSMYTAKSGLIDNFVLEKWNDADSLEYIVKAASAKNISGTNKWVLNNYYERYVGANGDIIKEGKRKDTLFNFTIDEMATRENVAEAMNYFDLKEFINRESRKGSSMVPVYEIELYNRTALPFATYILTIIGIAVSSRKKRGGVGINIAFGLGIIFIYIFTMKVTAVAAVNLGFPTLIAVWIPNFLFGVVAYFMYKNVQR